MMNDERSVASPSDESAWKSRWIARIEAVFFASFMALSLIHFAARAKIVEGFDGGGYWEMFQKVKIGLPLPGVREFWCSYHPPMTFWLVDIVHRLLGMNIPSTKAFFMLCMVFGMLCLREAMLRLRLLHTVKGITFLYCAAGLPLYVYLSGEFGLDSSVFFWTMLVLMLSVEAFFEPREEPNPRSEWMHIISLSLALAAAAMTKFSGFLSFLTPFFVIFVFRHSGAVRRRLLVQAGLSCVIAIAMIGPFYYAHYYRTEGRFIAVSIEWYGGNSLKNYRAERDEAPLLFLFRLLRVPEQSMYVIDRPPPDSLWSNVWFGTWKRDAFIGKSKLIPVIVGEIEATIFFFLLYAGTVLFVLRSRSREPWILFGWVLLGISSAFIFAILKFAYQYPLIDVVLMKAKYVAPALLWVPYCAALCVGEIGTRIRSERRAFVAAVILFVLIAAMLSANYLLPVY